jgi:protein TonB
MGDNTLAHRRTGKEDGMFDVIIKGHRNTSRRDVTPLVTSWALHALALGAVVLLPFFVTTDFLPVPEEVLTYVEVSAPPPPPPPPPPAAPAPAPAVKRPSPQPRPTPRPVPQAPVVAPRELPPAIETAGDEGAYEFDRIAGVAGGIPGGVPGGVIGGVLGGLAEVIPPPPPPPPPAPAAPVRTGGRIKPPALMKRVPPVYPPIAVNAQVEGVVVLEATVGRDGHVEDVKVLRSVTLLDNAAIDAVRQWVYAPLLLNGQAERFVLTVTVSFSLSS